MEDDKGRRNGASRRGAGLLDGDFAETWLANVLGLIIFTLAILWD